MKSYKFRQNPIKQFPAAEIGHSWPQILDTLLRHSSGSVAIETYQGVDIDLFIDNIRSRSDLFVLDSRTLMKPAEAIRQMIHPDLGDDALFGFMTRLRLPDYFPHPLPLPRAPEGKRLLVLGPGALLLLPGAETRVYADMPRWEIQMRQRQGLCDGLGLQNRAAGPKPLYKQGYFVDWRVLDRHKKQVLPGCHYYLESVVSQKPHLLPMAVLMDSLAEVAAAPSNSNPFSTRESGVDIG